MMAQSSHVPLLSLTFIQTKTLTLVLTKPHGHVFATFSAIFFLFLDPALHLVIMLLIGF